MTINPFAGINDALKRRAFESAARGAAKAASGALIAHGWATAMGAAKAEEIILGIAGWAIGEYFSQQSVKHTEKVIDVAQQSAPSVPRAVLEEKARQPSYVGGTGS